jgi:hypothetical protein
MKGEDDLKRYRYWLNYYVPRKEKLGVTHIALIDDCSEKGWINRLSSETNLRFRIIEVDDMSPDQELPLPAGPLGTDEILFIRFKENLGRRIPAIVPGWWRSYSFASVLGIVYQFERLIHIESDAYIFTKPIFDYFRNAVKGWHIFWSEWKQYPESSLQIINEAYFANMNLWWRNGTGGRAFWHQHNLTDQNYVPEFIIPQRCTHIVKVFKGDKYGRDFFDRIPADCDYACDLTDTSTGKREHQNEQTKWAQLDAIVQRINAAEEIPEPKPKENFVLYDTAGVIERAKEIQRMKWVPEGTDYISEQQDLAFDGTQLINRVAAVCHYNHGQLIKRILRHTHGFKQEDGTYAVFEYYIKQLEGIKNVRWEELDVETRDLYKTQAKRIVSAIFEFLE